ncbi:MAG: type VI secretion system baseplate subunit TssF [Proteobacteria bacterium]|nr:MAG: type VI secretion system baseplate subunit TssF [Pseudomonadota bacterium]
MDPRLLKYYNSELQYLREMGAEFAEQFTKIAGRLGMQGLEVADPYVERLLEGFAFLTARVQLKLDDEFPRFSQHLLNMVYPHYLAPTPSMAVVQFFPNLQEGSLAAGVPIPRGSALRGTLGKEDQTACEYQTAHDVTLWPIKIAAASYHTFVGNLGGVPTAETSRAKGLFRITLEAIAGHRFDALPIDRLPIFLPGDLELAGRLYEQLQGRTSSIWAKAVGSKRWHRAAGGVGAVGFDDDQALLPHGPRSFQGYRLLHEYFAFPSRFMFVEAQGLRAAFEHCSSEEIELLFLLDAVEPSLEGAVGPSNLALHCAPVINLFERRADRIHLSEATHEYHIVPDRTRPMDLEVYAIKEVIGYGARSTAQRTFLPFYAHTDEASEHSAYYTLRREKRRLSAYQRAHGARSSYVGSEVFIALVDGNEGPFHSDLKQLALETLCTNRDLPLHMPLGQGRTDFTMESGAPVASVRCLVGPTAPTPSLAHGEIAWRLISHLSLNYLSITDAATLRELLTLYTEQGERTAQRQIDAIQAVTSSPIIRRLAGRGASAVARGLEVKVVCDELGFHGASVFLLASVLNRFFAKYASVNSFCETVLETVQRGEVMRWPAQVGQANVL